MKIDRQVMNQILNIFPKLYYTTPIVRAYEVKIEATSFDVSELMDAILWLFDALVQDNEQGFCLQGQLEDLVCGWYGLQTPSSFTKTLGKLENAEFIEKSTDKKDKRNNKLVL